MQGLVTVFGGTGFIGAQVVRALAKKGLRVRVAVRNHGRGYRMRMLGDVGQIEVVQANVRVAESVERALVGAQGCINLVSVMHPTGRQTFQALNVDAARGVAEACARAGVASLVQVSAIGADAGSPSAYGRTKAAGEAAVRAAFSGAVIVRPSIVFGPEDDFFNRFGKMAASGPVLPLIAGGGTCFQPVFVGDVAQAIATALIDPASASKTYELGGPGVFSFKALMQIVAREAGRKPLLVPVPAPLASLLGLGGDLLNASPLAVQPPLTLDQVKQLGVDNVVSEGALTLADLGVTPTPLEAVLPRYMFRYRKGGQYADQVAAGV